MACGRFHKSTKGLFTKAWNGFKKIGRGVLRGAEVVGNALGAVGVPFAGQIGRVAGAVNNVIGNR